jgi:hypothetical protein
VNRRHFLQLIAAALAGSQVAAPGQTTPAQSPRRIIEDFFQPIVDGFLRNARATSPDLVTCDFAQGTKLKSCCTPSGKTYVSVARMLPALVTMRDGESLSSVFRHAFNPQHPDFWGYAAANKPTQRTVESALVADALVRCDRKILENLSPQQRSNIQKWLASCTQVPERKTNHAWFTALNHAARLALSRQFPEFQGDEAWMIEDLRALDAMYGNGTDGWYSDSPDQPIYDYYNFYVFPVFPLMWGRTIGEDYPDWNKKFQERVTLFLEKTPYFFAADGSYPLMGRSLIYRWALLTPLVLGYQEGLWPHSAGLLRRIVRKNLSWHWQVGAFDEKNGKLRETFSREGSPAVREAYIDNGHPYWCMPAFSVLQIPEKDAFWTAPEEPLPVEKDDFVVRFQGPRMLLSGCKQSGEVRWIQSQNAAKRDVYRDKYIKFAWSSHFPPDVATDREKVPFDQALVFIDRGTGRCAARAPAGVTSGKLLEDGVESTWWAQHGDWRFDVVTRVRLVGDFEHHEHRITAPQEAVGKIIVAEGAYALGDDGSADDAQDENAGTWAVLQSRFGTVGMWRLRGHERLERRRVEGLNLVHRRTRGLWAFCAIAAAQTTVATLHYASPKPPHKNEIARLGNELAKRWAEKS